MIFNARYGSAVVTANGRQVAAPTLLMTVGDGFPVPLCTILRRLRRERPACRSTSHNLVVTP